MLKINITNKGQEISASDRKYKKLTKVSVLLCIMFLIIFTVTLPYFVPNDLVGWAGTVVSILSIGSIVMLPILLVSTFVCGYLSTLDKPLSKKKQIRLQKKLDKFDHKSVIKTHKKINKKNKS